jgi:hypothetical protein
MYARLAFQSVSFLQMRTLNQHLATKMSRWERQTDLRSVITIFGERNCFSPEKNNGLILVIK